MATQPKSNIPKRPGFSVSKRIASAKIHEFGIITKFTMGYRNREDKTKLPDGVLIVGSQNVLTDVTGRVGITKGYVLDGQPDVNSALLQQNGFFIYQQNSGLILI